MPDTWRCECGYTNLGSKTCLVCRRPRQAVPPPAEAHIDEPPPRVEQKPAKAKPVAKKQGAKAKPVAKKRPARKKTT